MKTRIIMTTVAAIIIFAANIKGQVVSYGWDNFKWYLYEDSVYYYVDTDNYNTNYSTQNASIAELPVQTSVNEQGAAVVNLPLELPDAGNTLIPDLALHYNSMQTETMFGNEWGLAGLSEIRRINKSIYYDNVARSANNSDEIDGSEAFALNGNRLIITANNFPNTVSYLSETGNIKVKAHFVQRQDSLTKHKLRYANSYFEVFYPNGKTAVFGFEQLENNKSLLNFPIIRITDRLQNEVHYDYIFSYGEYRISKIRFGKNQIASVDFFYKADVIAYGKRQTADETEKYIVMQCGGLLPVIYPTSPPPFQEMHTPCVLNSIVIKYNNEEFRTYAFKNHANSKRVFLSSIQQLKKKPANETANNGSIDNEDPDIVVLQNDTAEFTMPLRFRYGENNSQPFNYTSESFTYNIADAAAKKGIFGNQQTSGIVIYPKVNTFYSQSCPANENIIVRPNLDKPETYTIQTGTGFLDILCVDLDNINGNEIVKINNRLSNMTDLLDFTVYTINEQGKLQYLYTRTYTTAFDITGNNPVYKEFLCGDFDGNGSNEILAVSSLLKTYQNRTETSWGEMYDLKNGAILYQNRIFDDVPVRNNALPPSPNKPVPLVYQYRTVLLAGDFNGDGKTDFLYKPCSGTFAALIEFDFENQNTRMRKLGNDFDVQSTNPTDYESDVHYSICDFNGDGKTDLYIPVSSILLSDGTKLIHNGPYETTPVYIANANYVIHDINDDGQSDLTTISSDQIITYLFDDGKIIAIESKLTDIASGYTPVAENYLNAQTSNNDLIFVNGANLIRFRLDIDHANSMVLKGVKSGSGTITDFEYGKMTDENIYTATNKPVFPYQNTMRNTTVVNKMRTHLNNTPLDVKTYKYENGITHHQGLGFCGFEKVITTDSLRNQTVTKIFDPLQLGILKQMESPAAKVINTYAVNIQSNKIAKVTLTKSVQTDKLKSVTVNKSYTYDAYGNVTQGITDYGSGLKTITDNVYNYYDSSSRYYLTELKQHTLTNQCSGQTSAVVRTILTYNSVGLPLTRIKYFNSTSYKLSEESFVYDSSYNLTTAKERTYTSATWQTKTRQYDPQGRVIKETDPTGLFVEYVYNGKGQLQKLKNHKGQETVFEYDNFGRKIKTTYPDNTVETSACSWADETAPQGALIKIIASATGKPTTVSYMDALGREIRSGEQRFDGSFIYTDKKYDNRGRLWKVSLPYKSSPTLWDTYTYDSYDRILSLAYASGKTDTYSYSGNSVLSAIDNVISIKAYNAAGQLVGITDNSGSITYNYRTDGQIASIVAGGVTTSFTYDTYGRQLTINDPSAGLKTLTYDAAGNVATEKDARNKQIKYTYDTYNRITKKEITGEQTLTIAYNTDNLPQSATSTNGTKTEYTYDTYLRPQTIKETNPDGKWFQKTMTYASGNVNTVNYATQAGNMATETYIYANGHKKEVKLASPAFTDEKSIWKLTAENDMGKPAAAATGDLTRSYDYDNYGLPTSRQITKILATNIFPRTVAGFASFSTGIDTSPAQLPGITLPKMLVTTFQDFRYSFNAQTGNLNWRKDAMESRDLQENFTYDTMNRLRGINSNSMNYDNKGNLTQNTLTGLFKYEDASKPYQITSATPYNNSILLRDQSITYNAMQRPATITENGSTATFTYNANGDRVKMTWNGTSNYYFGSKYEIVNSKEMLYLCGDAYTSPAVMVKENGTWKLYYIGRDYLGSITHIINEDCTLKQELSYDAWGRLRNPANQQVYAAGSEPALFLGRGYTGHEHLTQFGLINMNARLYDPALGRFLSPDPYIQAPANTQNYNRYSYCLNNPLKYTDPSGKKSLCQYEWDELIGAYRDGYGHIIEESSKWQYENGFKGTGDFTSSAGGGWDIGGNYYEPGHYYYNPITNQIRFLDRSGAVQGAWLRTLNLNQNKYAFKGRRMEDSMDFLNFGLGALSTQYTWKSGYFLYNEAWHLTQTRGLSTILNKGRWNNNGAKSLRAKQVKPFGAARNAGKGIRVAGGVGLGADILLSGEVGLSHLINGSMIAVSGTGVGSVIAALWFVADYGTGGVNYLMGNGFNTLSNIIDNAVGTYEMYEGLY